MSLCEYFTFDIGLGDISFNSAKSLESCNMHKVKVIAIQYNDNIFSHTNEQRLKLGL